MLFTFLSLPQRATELASVEGYAVFVQDAEDGAAAVKIVTCRMPAML